MASKSRSNLLKAVKQVMKQQQPAKKGKGRKAKRSRKAAGGVALSGMTAMDRIDATIPNRLVSRRRAYISVPEARKSLYGDNVVALHGSQQISTVSNGAGGSAILGSATNISVSPDAFGSSLAAMANRYTKYFFTKLQFEYIPYQPNSTDGHGFAFGFVPEGVTTVEFTVDFSKISQLEHSMVLPMTGFLGGPWVNTLCVIPSRKANPWYWNEDDTATTAAQRQTIQGQFCGASDSAITNASTWGTIWLTWEIELCDISPDQGFTLKRLMRQLGDKPMLRRELLTTLLEQEDEGGWDRASARSLDAPAGRRPR